MEQNNYQGALQIPIHSGFNSTSTASDVIKGIDLIGKVVVLTGGNTGITLETTKTLASTGATVSVPARYIEKVNVHLLINNAGIMWGPLRRDSRGFESQLATSYLASFQLTARLWPVLKKPNGARVINVSSGGHGYAQFDFVDPGFLHRHYEQG